MLLLYAIHHLYWLLINKFNNLPYPCYVQESSPEKNECGGILAFISKSEDARNFCQANSHLLQKTPYQQCGLLFRNETQKTVDACKFTSLTSEQLTMAMTRQTDDEYMLYNHMIVD